jgi:hypothetical protein
MGLGTIPRALEICLRGRWCLFSVCGCGSNMRIHRDFVVGDMLAWYYKSGRCSTPPLTFNLYFTSP